MVVYEHLWSSVREINLIQMGIIPIILGIAFGVGLAIHPERERERALAVLTILIVGMIITARTGFLNEMWILTGIAMMWVVLNAPDFFRERIIAPIGKSIKNIFKIGQQD